ncbi:hypothetical protein AAG906_007519 [Vitis piasezkii]
MWLKVEGFKDLLKSWWEGDSFSGSSSFILAEKLKVLKAKLKEWNRDIFGRVEYRKDLALEQVEFWDAKEKISRLSLEELEARKEAREEYKKWVLLEEITWRQKSREVWLKEGDRNTGFFHKMANAHRRRNNVDKIRINGVWLTEENGIKEGIVNAFRSLLSNPGDWRPSHMDACALEMPFTEDEVFDALLGCNGDKASGLDGFSMVFWYLNATLMVLIPKKAGAEVLGDFRPISLYKWLAKVLANRLKKVVGKVVSKAQGAFVEGIDAVLIANEAIDSALKNNENDILCKLDIEKAYDNVDWSFILTVMHKMGFGEKWIRWIKWCISTASFSMLVNGTPTGFFQSSRGLRQGDPLSPYLFVIAMEVFSALLKRAMEGGFISGCRVVSGLRINLEKSELIPVGRVENIDDLAWDFGSSRGLTSDLLVQRALRKGELEELILREEIHWRQKARVKWVKEGDYNSKFFHKVANDRRNRKFIKVLENERGLNLIRDGRLKAKHQWVVLFCLEQGGIRAIRGSFFEEEVFAAPANLSGDNAPGPDGSLRRSLKATFIVLISKKEGAKDLRDFHPINLVGSLYKILAKVLVNRLKRVVRKVISNSQHAFVEGRQILDVILIANKVLDSRLKSSKSGVICKMDIEKAYDHALSWAFMWFEAISGLKINLDKSELIPVGEVSNAEELARVISKKKKLAMWKRRYLSKGGRLTLIKSTLSSLPIYFISLFVIPRKVSLKLEKLQRDFLWGGREGKSLGIRKLSTLNKKPLGKWSWRFASKNKVLWKLVIVGKYGEEERGWCSRAIWNGWKEFNNKVVFRVGNGRRGGGWNLCFSRSCNDWEVDYIESFLVCLYANEREALWRRVINLKYGEEEGGWRTQDVIGRNGVGLWKAIKKKWWLLDGRVAYHVGNGQRVRFWKDKWCGDGPLCESFSSLFSISMSKIAWVSEVWNPVGDGDGWTTFFARAFNDWEIDLVERLLQKIHAFRVQREEEDRVIWSASNDGAFSVKSLYSIERIWRVRVPPKVAFFAWEASWGKVLTLENLQRRGFSLANRQPFLDGMKCLWGKDAKGLGKWLIYVYFGQSGRREID